MFAFCSKNETIEHLFIDCLYAKFLWRSVHFVLGLKPPKDIQDFLQVVQTRGVSNQSFLLKGCAVICWKIWLTKDEVFDKCRHKNFFAGYTQRNILAMSMGTITAG